MSVGACGNDTLAATVPPLGAGHVAGATGGRMGGGGQARPLGEPKLGRGGCNMAGNGGGVKPAEDGSGMLGNIGGCKTVPAGGGTVTAAASGSARASAGGGGGGGTVTTAASGLPGPLPVPLASVVPVNHEGPPAVLLDSDNHDGPPVSSNHDGITVPLGLDPVDPAGGGPGGLGSVIAPIFNAIPSSDGTGGNCSELGIGGGNVCGGCITAPCGGCTTVPIRPGGGPGGGGGCPAISIGSPAAAIALARRTASSAISSAAITCSGWPSNSSWHLLAVR